MNALYYDIIKTKLEELGFVYLDETFCYQKGSIGIEVDEISVKVFRNGTAQIVQIENIEDLEDLIKFCK